MKYLLICQHCGNREFTDGKTEPTFFEIKNAPVPARADGKNSDTIKLPKKYKCPKCGFGFKVVKTEVTAPKPKEEMPPQGQEFFREDLPPLK